MATLIGSVPYTSPSYALERFLEVAPEAPLWPQLPKRHWREGLLPQYAEGLPGLVEHAEDGKVSVNKEAEEVAHAMTRFYEAAMKAQETGDFSYFEISEKASLGIPTARAVFSKLTSIPPYVKVHTTGPVSFALGVFDEKDIPVYYDDNYADIVLQNTIMKSIWQIRLFKPYGENIICFIDEPTLSSFGSSVYINVTQDQVVSRLSSVVRALHEEGAIVGVHVCGNSEWTMLMDAEVDILSFDAYNYGEGMALYAPQVSEYLKNGAALAWGIVPTSAAIGDESAASLEKKLTRLVEHLAGHGVDRDLIWEQSIITPSCGLGSMTEADAERVLDTLSKLALSVQEKIR
jgi:methionine synthase II (cobalamin-independent)